MSSFSHRSPLVKASSKPDARTLRMVVDDDHHYGPELLLTPIMEYMTNHRDDSPVRRTGSNHLRQRNEALVAYSIPIADIMVVETYNVRYGSPLHKLTITTISYGVFEFDCNSSNGHDILLAFLQAKLDPERILDGAGVDDSPFPCISDSPSTASCLDVDGLTARHVRGRVENETWPEKISRRMGKVVNSLQEISSTFCEMTCCRSEDCLRERPPRSSFRYNDLGLEEEAESPSPPRKSLRKDYDHSYGGKHHQSYDGMHYHMPSGLSIESEPELEPAR
jgi:hypothetical protein